MKNNNSNLSRMNIVIVVVVCFAFLGIVLVDVIEMRLVIAVATFIVIAGVYVAQKCLRKPSFSDLAIKKFKKAGFACKKEDDGFLVKQGEFIVKAKLWNSNTHGLKRVHFMFDFEPQTVDAVLPEGWAMLATECNAKFDHAIVKFYGDHFCCMVETSVKSTRDLLNEYYFARDNICETIYDLASNTKKVTRQFPARKKQMGFIV